MALHTIRALERRKLTLQTLSMTNKVDRTDKEIVQELLHSLPDNASLDDIVQELEFVAAVREGLSGLDESKDSISIEKVEPRTPAWSVTIGRRRRGRSRAKQHHPKKVVQAVGDDRRP